MRLVTTDAYQCVGVPSENGLLFTCEHASNRVPGPWRPRPADRKLLELHWGYDIGAANMTQALVRQLGAFAILSRFSRLLLDPNRAPEDPSLILSQTDDGCPSFNRRVTDQEQKARISRFHTPFHAVIDDHMRRFRPRLLLSIHSFTPVFRGQVRQLEAGVLFDRHDALGEAWVEGLRRAGLKTEANEPYSGKLGLIYSAARHGTRHEVPYLELEVRQDCIDSAAKAHKMAHRIREGLQLAGLWG